MRVHPVSYRDARRADVEIHDPGVHLAGASRSESLRDQLEVIFEDLPDVLRRSLTWDQGAEMCHHHLLTDATRIPVFFCHPGRPWRRPSNENTNGLLRNYFPKGTDLRVHTADDLARVANELNLRPSKTLGWSTPHSLFATLRNGSAYDDRWNPPSTPGEFR